MYVISGEIVHWTIDAIVDKIRKRSKHCCSQKIKVQYEYSSRHQHEPNIVNSKANNSSFIKKYTTQKHIERFSQTYNSVFTTLENLYAQLA